MMFATTCRYGLLVGMLLASGITVADESKNAKQLAVMSKGNQSGIALDKLKRSVHKKSGKNLFTTKSWGDDAPKTVSKPAPVVTAAPVSAPLPAAVPSLPFVYMGKMVDVESGKMVLYLAKGDVAYSVSEGDVIDGTYRVLTISDTELTLIYLPSNTRQTLFIGGSNS